MPIKRGQGGLQVGLEHLAGDVPAAEVGVQAEDLLEHALAGFVRRARGARIPVVRVRLETDAPTAVGARARRGATEYLAWAVQPYDLPPCRDAATNDPASPADLGIYVLENGELLLTDRCGALCPESLVARLRAGGESYLVASLAAFLASPGHRRRTTNETERIHERSQ